MSKIVICGSTNVSMDEIKKAEEYFAYLFETASVITPEIKPISIFKTQLNYVNHIKTADLVVIVPKSISYNGYCSDVLIGDSTNYEMAIAKSLNIPTVIWKGNM